MPFLFTVAFAPNAIGMANIPAESSVSSASTGGSEDGTASQLLSFSHTSIVMNWEKSVL